MNYFLFKLRFSTAVHFGASDSALPLYTSETHFCADTLFSALCHEALSLFGENGVHTLVRLAKAGELLLTDSMPWNGDAFFLPKPCITAEQRQELPADRRKAMKKLQWIPVGAFSEFAASISGSGSFDPDKYAGSFGELGEAAKVRVTDGADSFPYQVGLFRFHEDCGLYFIAAVSPEAEKLLPVLVDGLGLDGIGGKTSAGYGKYQAECISMNLSSNTQIRWLFDSLSTGDTARHLLLTSSLPSDDELDSALDGAYYGLIRRSGFACTKCEAETIRKKQTQMYLAAGSVLVNRFAGCLYEVGGSESHPVYRYSKPVFLGVLL